MHSSRPYPRDIAILTLFFIVFFGFMLGSRPLTPPDEGRYVEIPREMIATGDFVTPRLNGVKYFEKPPLVYWLQAGAMKIAGEQEWGWRLVNCLMAILSCLGTYIFGRATIGRKEGLAASLILSSTLLLYAMSRVITLDMTVSTLITGALGSFWLAVQPYRGRSDSPPNALSSLLPNEQPPTSSRWAPYCKWLFFIFMALASLAKGLIGIVLPGSIILLWIAATRQWSALKLAFNPGGILLFFAIAAPWHILVSIRNPEFLNFYFIQEHFLRYLTPMHNRVQPVWFFGMILGFGLFPWQGFLIGLRKHILKPPFRELDLYLLLWTGFVFIFFSISKSKLIPYILPTLPPIAVLLSRYMVKLWEGEEKPDKLGIYIFIAFSAMISTLLICTLNGWLSASLTERVQSYSNTLLPTELLKLKNYLTGVALVMGGGALLLFVLSCVSTFRTMIITMLATVIGSYWLMNAGFATLAPRSSKNIAAEIKKHLTPKDLVAIYHNYYQDLPVYLGRTVTVVGWKNEMEFGTTVEDATSWMMDAPPFWAKWKGSQRIFLVTNQDTAKQLLHSKEYAKDLHELARIRDQVLFTNQP